MIRQRFETLDAMRGVAAIAVVTLHLGAYIAPIKVPHAYLAVDFFFALSGLVLARAYGARFDAGLGVREFLRMRMIRFYPLYVLGTCIGFAAILWPMVRGYTARPGPVSLVFSILASLIMLPGPSIPGDLPYLMLPYDPPAWSLLFELVANVSLVACWRYLNRWVLGGLLVVSAALLLVQCLATGALIGGATWTTVPVGATRTLFSFTVGLGMARLLPSRMPRSSLTAWLPLLVLGVVFLPGAWVGPWYDLSCVFVVMPLLLFWGASVEPISKAPFHFLGVISFALYAIHDQLVNALPLVLFRLPQGRWTGGPWVGLVALPAFVLLAWLSDAFYDRPAREWLRRRLSAPRSGAL